MFTLVIDTCSVGDEKIAINKFSAKRLQPKSILPITRTTAAATTKTDGDDGNDGAATADASPYKVALRTSNHGRAKIH